MDCEWVLGFIGTNCELPQKTEPVASIITMAMMGTARGTTISVFCVGFSKYCADKVFRLSAGQSTFGKLLKSPASQAGGASRRKS
jgi:hypothetical protein